MQDTASKAYPAAHTLQSTSGACWKSISMLLAPAEMSGSRSRRQLSLVFASETCSRQYEEELRAVNILCISMSCQPCVLRWSHADSLSSTSLCWHLMQPHATKKETKDHASLWGNGPQRSEEQGRRGPPRQPQPQQRQQSQQRPHAPWRTDATSKHCLR